MINLTDEKGREIEFGSDMQYTADYQDVRWKIRTNIEKKYTFKPKNESDTYYIYVLSDGERVNLYIDSLKEILPELIILILFISLVLSILYAKHVAVPVIRISELARKLADLNFVNYVDTGRKDELGRIEESLYELSERLSVALSELENAKKICEKKLKKRGIWKNSNFRFFHQPHMS